MGGQVAIVTGALGGIGRATVNRFIADGIQVVAVDLNPPTNDSDNLVHVAGDVTEPETAVRATATALERFGRLDILVNNAGIGSDQIPIWEIPLETWRRDIDVNLTGQFLLCQAVIPTMIANGYGRIVNVASAAGMEGHPRAGGYAAAKAGVVAMTKTLGKELATTGVIVNCIAPALIETDMIDQPWFTDEIRELLLSRIPMGRMGTPAEVAEMIAFLASSKVTFSTGAVFDLSGGRATY